MNEGLKGAVQYGLKSFCPPAYKIAQYCYKPYRLYFKLKGRVLKPSEFFRAMTGLNDSWFIRFRKELIVDEDLFFEVNKIKRYAEIRGFRVDFSEWHYLLYTLIRAIKPNVMVETGVFDGHSSTVILLAMENNAKGELLSIDLPAVEVIQDSTSGIPAGSLPRMKKPGWMIPDNLRHRHKLILGDARTILPETLARLKRISIFLHDSLHTFDHMLFEYKTAFKYIENGGLLLSDDVWANYAFVKFCRTFNQCGYVTGDFGGILVHKQSEC
jgi:hypothetical protein